MLATLSFPHFLRIYVYAFVGYAKSFHRLVICWNVQFCARVQVLMMTALKDARNARKASPQSKSLTAEERYFIVH